jgi:glutaminyl-tRNA synthetase
MINAFCEDIGVSRKGNENITSYKKIEFYARKELDAEAPRTFGITEGLLLEIVNYADIPEAERTVEAVLFPAQPERGTQKYRLESEVYIETSDFSAEEQKGFFGLMPGQPVVLRYGPTVKIVEVVRNKAGAVERVRVEKIPFEKKTKVVHWISKAHAIPVEIRLYDSLLTEIDVKEASKISGKNWLEYMNPEALIIKDKSAFVWNLHKNAKVLDRFQFERVGYFAVDSDSVGSNLVFNRIVELKESSDKKGVPAPVSR